ncbi:MAG: hypothetical protein AAF597_00555, partial [Bacteroidota bacterium]
IVRLDHDPIVSETVTLPLSWVNEWRKSSDTYTYANHVDNYDDHAATIPYPNILTLEPGGATNAPATLEGAVLHCCGEGKFALEANSAKELALEAVPDYLTEMSCQEELKDHYSINYFLSGSETSPITLLPELNPEPAPIAIGAPPTSSSLATAITKVLNQTGNPDLDPDTRFALIGEHLKLFTQDAHVKVYGDNGTITSNYPIEDYLEMLSLYRTIDTIHIDQALMRDQLCWEVRVREIHQ